MESEIARFNFRVTASREKEWWTNVSPAELTKLRDDYEAVILAVWHPPTDDKWLKTVLVFAIPPSDVIDGLAQNKDVILGALLRATLLKVSKQQGETPGLAHLLQQKLLLQSLVDPIIRTANLETMRQDADQIIKDYCVTRAAQLSDEQWQTIRKRAARIRGTLWTIMLHVGPDPHEPEAYRLYHQKTGTVLACYGPETGRFVEIHLDPEHESKPLALAYSTENGDSPFENLDDDNGAPAVATRTDVDSSGKDDEGPGEIGGDGPLEVFDPIAACEERLRDQLVGIALSEILTQVWSALDSGKHVVLTGVPGTAKTTIAETVAAVAAEAERCSSFLFTAATTDWTALDTVGGYLPDPAPGKKGLVFKPGKFLECFRDPESGEKEFRWIVIDELNRTDVDKAFGQFFTILSGHPCELPYRHDGRRVVVVPVKGGPGGQEDNSYEGRYDEKLFYVYRVPGNWRMLATLNTDDKASLYEMSFAFLRRFAFVHIPVPTDSGLKDLCQRVLETRIGLPHEWAEKLRELWSAITKVRSLGPALLIDMARYVRQRMSIAAEEAWPVAVGEALMMYLVPQLEGLSGSQLRRFKAAVEHADRGYWTALLEEAASAFLPSMEDLHATASGDAADRSHHGFGLNDLDAS